MTSMRSRAAFDRANADRTCASAALLATFAAIATATPPSLLGARRDVPCESHSIRIENRGRKIRARGSALRWDTEAAVGLRVEPAAKVVFINAA